jgi:protein phosphatase 2C family protein 2/3
MEDAHATILNLDEATDETNTFFAVYDGHGGVCFHWYAPALSHLTPNKGDSVAKFAGQNVHKRLVKEEAYHKRQYEAALRRTFLGTDEDVQKGKSVIFSQTWYDHVV